MQSFKKLIQSFFSKKTNISLLDGNLVSHQEYVDELNYKNDLDYMLDTVHNGLEKPDGISKEPAIQEFQDYEDNRYMKLYNQIIVFGISQLTETDQIWLRDYLKENKKHWYSANFEIVRRKKIV